MRVLSLNERTYYINSGIMAEMRNQGYKVKIVPLGDYKVEEQAQVLDEVLSSFRPDYVLTPGWSVDMFDLEGLFNALRKHHTFHVYWATEDPLFFEEVSMKFAPFVNYVFTLADECNRSYRKLGIQSSTLLFGCNPHFFYPRPPKSEYQHDIVLVANNYHWFSEDKSFRRKAIQDLVAPLVAGGYDIKIWGVDWTNPEFGFHIDPKYYGGYCKYKHTPEIYSSAKIVLGLQSVNDSLTQTSTRTFEIMGTGAFYLTCYTPAHENLFKNHRHLVWTHSAAETVELVDYYLKHDAERRAIAARARTKILKRHTYRHRLAQMENDLKAYLTPEN